MYVQQVRVLYALRCCGNVMQHSKRSEKVCMKESDNRTVLYRAKLRAYRRKEPRTCIANLTRKSRQPRQVNGHANNHKSSCRAPYLPCFPLVAFKSGQPKLWTTFSEYGGARRSPRQMRSAGEQSPPSVLLRLFFFEFKATWS